MGFKMKAVNGKSHFATWTLVTTELPFCAVFIERLGPIPSPPPIVFFNNYPKMSPKGHEDKGFKIHTSIQ
jgi:hypothetical protein